MIRHAEAPTRRARTLLTASAPLAWLALSACAEPPRAPAPATPPASAPAAPAAPAASPSAPPASPPEASASVPGPGLPAAKLGEMCGGFAGIACGPGLVCANVMPVPDGSGTCRKASVAP